MEPKRKEWQWIRELLIERETAEKEIDRFLNLVNVRLITRVTATWLVTYAVDQGPEITGTMCSFVVHYVNE